MPDRPLRVAAVGDVHATEPERSRLEAALLDVDADVLLIAGDLTAHGTPEEAAILADACACVDAPVLTVLGNHDHHGERADEITAVLEAAGITVLERQTRVVETEAGRLGVAGCKGFIGGFTGSRLPDFGEPLLRRVYAEASKDVDFLDAALGELADADWRVVLLHYAPVRDTVLGEPEGIHAYLGCDRLADPIARHGADLVLHGHAHHGSCEGRIGEDIRVFNVAQPLLDTPIAGFELPQRASRPD